MLLPNLLEFLFAPLWYLPWILKSHSSSLYKHPDSVFIHVPPISESFSEISFMESPLLALFKHRVLGLGILFPSRFGQPAPTVLFMLAFSSKTESFLGLVLIWTMCLRKDGYAVLVSLSGEFLRLILNFLLEFWWSINRKLKFPKFLYSSRVFGSHDFIHLSKQTLTLTTSRVLAPRLSSADKDFDLPKTLGLSIGKRTVSSPVVSKLLLPNRFRLNGILEFTFEPSRLC